MTCILIFCGYCFWSAWFARVICPLMQEHSLRLKNLISQAPEDAMLKTRRPVYKRLFKSNGVLRADQKSDVNQTYKQSVFSPMAACISIWCASGAVERRSQMFVYRLSPFPFSFPAIFSPFPQTETLFTSYLRPEARIPIQSNLSNTDTEGTEQSVRIREVSVV